MITTLKSAATPRSSDRSSPRRTSNGLLRQSPVAARAASRGRALATSAVTALRCSPTVATWRDAIGPTASITSAAAPTPASAFGRRRASSIGASAPAAMTAANASDVHGRHVVPDRVEQRAAGGAQHRDRQRRRQRARHRHVERRIGDDQRVRRPAPAPQTQAAIEQPEGRADRDVVPVVRRNRPDRPRQIATRQRQRLRQHERRRQAQRADEVMRVRRFSSSHETMTDVEDALAGAFQIQSWTMTRRAGGRS